MSPRAFDRIMLDVEAGGNAKLGRLTDAEFRCHVTGVLPLAAKSPIRGRLLVGEHKAEAGDVARQARMSVTVAQRTIGKLRDLGVLEPDEELGCEMVHDFDDWNPAPKKDRTNAERQARYRLRVTARYEASRNGVTNGAVTPTKRSEEKSPLIPPVGNPDFEKWLLDHEQVTGHKPPKPGTKARAALADAFNARIAEHYSVDDLKAATVGAHADEYRRSNGYDVAESCLRPTKIADLIAKGRMRLRNTPAASGDALAAAFREAQ